MLLPAHIRQVEGVRRLILIGEGGGVGDVGADALVAAQVGRKLREGVDGVDGRALHQRRLRRVRRWHEDRLHAALAGQRHHRQDAMRMPQPAVEAQLTEEQCAFDLRDWPGRREGRDLLCRQQDADSDGQVVGGASLAQVGGGEVDDDTLQREDGATVLDGGAHPLLRLVDGGVGQADQRKRGQPMRDVYLDFDNRAFQAHHRATAHLCQHRSASPRCRSAAQRKRRLHYPQSGGAVNPGPGAPNGLLHT